MADYSYAREAEKGGVYESEIPRSGPNSPRDHEYDSSGEYIPKDADAGELALNEAAAGGLGRHLGVFSTTFLMYESAVH